MNLFPGLRQTALEDTLVLYLLIVEPFRHHIRQVQYGLSNRIYFSP
jgi:hypothetical protein